MKKLLLFLLLSIHVFGQKVDTLEVFSKSMQKTLKNVVILPDEYQKNDKDFPVLYLLHGAYGDFTNWITKVPDIKNYANQYNMIIVCPDGDPFSWYFDSPIDKKYRYETYISTELIHEIDEKYKTIRSVNGRAITGLSMGGHGAFYLAFRHQDIFGAAGSMSGGMDLVRFAKKKNYELKNRLGDFSKNPENWINNTIINMTDLVLDTGLRLYFDCGLDDFMYESNRDLHLKLIEKNIQHEYTERPGNHNWDYWANSIKYHMVFFDSFFKEITE